MKKPYFPDIFNQPIDEFKKHLEDEDNGRIIFSGHYGVGKTRFLEDFFQPENQRKILGKEKYNVYRLSPVNYALVHNDDIIDYIKYDIVTDFLKREYHSGQSYADLFSTLPEFLNKHADLVLATVCYMIPKVGKEVEEIWNKIMEVRKEWQKYQVEKKKMDEDWLEDLLSKVETKAGSFYANDVVTAIIKQWVNREGKHNILIIDDLDRLDPEHIFRILNVFSAHFGKDYFDLTQNKFGFNKVILVADYGNIRNLFHHRYGEKADFAGYMDKFFSTEVYHFDNNAALTSILKKVFDSFSFKNVGREQEGFHHQLFGDGFLLQLLTLFVSARRVRLRSLVRLYGKEWDIHRQPIQFSRKHQPIDAYQFPMVMRLRFLQDLIGDPVILDHLLDECREKNIPFDPRDQFFGTLLLVASFRKHNYLASSENVFEEEFEKHYIAVSPNVNGGHHLIDAQVASRRGTGNERKIEGAFSASPSEFWIALKNAINELRRISFIKQ